MAYENNETRNESVYSNRVRAGKRRTYFFDVKSTRNNDYFLTITESRKRFDDNGYDRHKIFLYKEDFNKFIKGMIEAVDYVKTELMPDYDFDAFNHDNYEENAPQGETVEMSEAFVPEPATQVTELAEVAEVHQPVAFDATTTEEVDKW